MKFMEWKFMYLILKLARDPPGVLSNHQKVIYRIFEQQENHAPCKEHYVTNYSIHRFLRNSFHDRDNKQSFALALSADLNTKGDLRKRYYFTK